MRRLVVGLGVGVVLVCTPPVRLAEARGPSTEEERAKVVALTRELERDPLGGDASEARRWLRAWVIEVPDLRVYDCPGLLRPDLPEDHPYRNEIDMQRMFSAAAFAVEDPRQVHDDVAQYIAGVEGALRVYETLLMSSPEARVAILDDLLARREGGRLADHVAFLAQQKCKRANPELIFGLAGAGVGLFLAVFVAWLAGRHRWSPGPGRGRMATIGRHLVFAGAAYYLIVVAALHVLEPEFDPRYRFVSEYVWGAYGWIMTTTFFALGLATVALAAGLREVHDASRTARLGLGLLVVAGVFVCLAGVFKEFIPHAAASAVGIPGIVSSALVLSWSFRGAPAWRSIFVPTFLLAVGMLAVLSALVAHIGMAGVEQRALLLMFLLWLAIVGHRLGRVTTVPWGTGGP